MHYNHSTLEKKTHLKEIIKLLPIYAHNSIQHVRLKAPDFFSV